MGAERGLLMSMFFFILMERPTRTVLTEWDNGLFPSIEVDGNLLSADLLAFRHKTFSQGFSFIEYLIA